MLYALPLAQQPCAGDGHQVGANAAFLAISAVKFLAKPLQAPDRLRLQPTIGQFLDPIGEAAFEIAPVEG